MKLDNLKIAHRGIYNNEDIPENSILAFNKALKKKLSIEFDIQLTKDNILVIFHDDNLKRMTNLDKTLQKCTYKELQQLNLLNTNQKIPTLKEVLKLVDGKVLIDIEIKDTKRINLTCNKLVEELNNYPYPFIVKSFNPNIVRWFHKNKPEYITGLLINSKHYNKIYSRLILNYCKPNFLAFDKKYINKYKLKSHYKKYPILIWTIKKEEEMNKYKNITNNYICDNIQVK